MWQLILFVFIILVGINIYKSTSYFPFQDLKALNNRKEFIYLDTINVKSLEFNIINNDDEATNKDAFKFFVKLENTNQKHIDIRYYQNDYDISSKIIKNGAEQKLPVLKSKINDNVFLNDEGYLRYIKRSNYLKIYLYISGFLIGLFWLIKKIKAK